MLPLTVGIRDRVVQLVSILGGVVTSARAGFGSVIVAALPVVSREGCELREVWGGRGEG